MSEFFPSDPTVPLVPNFFFITIYKLEREKKVYYNPSITLVGSSVTQKDRDKSYAVTIATEIFGFDLDDTIRRVISISMQLAPSYKNDIMLVEAGKSATIYTRKICDFLYELTEIMEKISGIQIEKPQYLH